MGTIGATFLLIGIGLIYAATGALYMMDLAARLPAVIGGRTVLTALAFIIVGVALKLVLFPLRHLLPNAYTYSPTVITVFLAATATNVAVYVMLRMLFMVFPANLLHDTPAGLLFVVLEVAGVLVASYQAIPQLNVKRTLALTSVAQIGYMALGIGFGAALGVTAVIIHLFNHAMMKGALSMAVGALAYRVGSGQCQDLAGLGRRMPWTFAAIEQQDWVPVAVILIGSLLAMIYVWKLVDVFYFRPQDIHALKASTGRMAGQAPDQIREAPLSVLLPTWVLVLANVYLGLNTDLTFKRLLFMTMGAILYRTGNVNGSDLGGMYKSTPKTAILRIFGASSISAFLLFSGFASNSMVMTAVIQEGHPYLWLMLLFASAGVLHHAGIKIRYFAFFHHDAGIRSEESPANMLLAVAIAAALCIFIGNQPQYLYALLPWQVDYRPYDLTHVLAWMQLLFFSAMAFVWLNKVGLYPPEPHPVNIDAEWL